MRGHYSVYFTLKKRFLFSRDLVIKYLLDILPVTLLYLGRLVEKTLVLLMALPF